MQNWYQTYKLNKQAGFKDFMFGSLLTGIGMILFQNFSPEEVSQKMNIPVEQISQALKNQDIIDAVKEQNSEQSTPTENKPTPTPDPPSLTLDSLVNAIIVHEGLIERQTPFRITNPEMRKWTKIHGFEIDRTSPKPSNRQNFIFLKNTDDVPKAIRQQLLNYAKNPQRYGLGKNPTIEQALRVFDQTGASGKIKFLTREIQGFNPKTPLSAII